MSDKVKLPRTGTTGDDWAKLDPRLAHLASRKNLSAPTPRKPKRTVLASPLPLPVIEDGAITITLPLPPRELQPNLKTKINQYKLTKLIKATRDAAHFVTSLAQVKHDGAVRMDVTMWNKNRLDRDGVIGWLKHTQDGIASALGANDQHFEICDIVQNTGKESRGWRQVEMVITPLDSARFARSS